MSVKHKGQQAVQALQVSCFQQKKEVKGLVGKKHQRPLNSGVCDTSDHLTSGACITHRLVCVCAERLNALLAHAQLPDARKQRQQNRATGARSAALASMRA